jgi:hypothetical protein
MNTVMYQAGVVDYGVVARCRKTKFMEAIFSRRIDFGSI